MLCIPGFYFLDISTLHVPQDLKLTVQNLDTFLCLSPISSSSLSLHSCHPRMQLRDYPHHSYLLYLSTFHCTLSHIKPLDFLKYVMFWNASGMLYMLFPLTVMAISPQSLRSFLLVLDLHQKISFYRSRECSSV